MVYRTEIYDEVFTFVTNALPTFEVIRARNQPDSASVGDKPNLYMWQNGEILSPQVMGAPRKREYNIAVLCVLLQKFKLPTESLDQMMDRYMTLIEDGIFPEYPNGYISILNGKYNIYSMQIQDRINYQSGEENQSQAITISFTLSIHST